TATQSLMDGPVHGSDFRKGRTAALNIVPTTTGAAVAVTKAYPELVGKFDGIALRVPVAAGSIADITFIAKTETSVEEINDALTKASQMEQWKGLLSVTREPLVSSDIIGQPIASIADLSMTRVVGGKLVKVLTWYDNEVGYTESLVQHVIASGNIE
ncbi:MAG TPA: type I glyceraldehyde-3-phosphate dehydrogenase, partial [Candidatus Kaiserbacteria bacterium]|nr:type I glyceraldehyde-3-phosphate dehydrogenase [Candidatus Kaiserbacteria bacterium]